MSNNTFRNIICDTIFLEAGHPALFRSSGHLIENSKAWYFSHLGGISFSNMTYRNISFEGVTLDPKTIIVPRSSSTYSNFVFENVNLQSAALLLVQGVPDIVGITL